MPKSELRCLECGAVMGRAAFCPECGWTYAPESAPQDSDESIEIVSAIVDPSVVPADVSAGSLDEPPQSAPPPARTNAELWFEVLAVLSVGVFPYCVYAFTPGSFDSQIVTSIGRSVTGASHIYLTLYLIHRSGEPWERFGLCRFRGNDVILSIVMLMISRICLILSYLVIPASADSFMQLPAQTPGELFALLIVYLFNGFSEEIVTRAYLITRFEQLLKSQWKAVALASLLFAFYHLYQGIGGGFNALLFGVAYSIAFLLFRSIWPLGIGHACSNFFSELLIYGR